MKITAHRGHWLAPAEKNTRTAFIRALEGGFGIETDLRDAGARVVISHDMPRGHEMALDEFLSLCAAHPSSGPLALNIKADGLQALVKDALARHTVGNAFVFDMAVPDALGYLRAGVPTYTRCSEYENPPPCLTQASGIWLDAFHSEWYGIEVIKDFLSLGKSVCIVSPELHGRAHLPLWQSLRGAGLHQHTRLSICTDFPLEAKEAFHVAHQSHHL